MSSETLLRQEIRDSLGFVRSMIDHYSGLYTGENLTQDVLRFCDEVAMSAAPNPRLREARRVVEERPLDGQRPDARRSRADSLCRHRY